MGSWDDYYCLFQLCLTISLVEWLIAELQEVCAGELPYREVKNSTLLFQYILKRQLPLRPNDFNDKLWGLFLHCCVFEPSERHTISSSTDEISKLLSPVMVAYQSSSSPPSIAREDLRVSTNPSPDPIITNASIQGLDQDIERERQQLLRSSSVQDPTWKETVIKEQEKILAQIRQDQVSSGSGRYLSDMILL